MTAKKKADELVIKFYDTFTISWEYDNWVLAEECALIAVDEIIKQLVPIEKAPNNKSAFQYWQEVKQEIEKL